MVVQTWESEVLRVKYGSKLSRTQNWLAQNSQFLPSRVVNSFTPRLETGRVPSKVALRLDCGYKIVKVVANANGIEAQEADG